MEKISRKEQNPLKIKRMEFFAYSHWKTWQRRIIERCLLKKLQFSLDYWEEFWIKCFFYCKLKYSSLFWPTLRLLILTLSTKSWKNFLYFNKNWASLNCHLEVSNFYLFAYTLFQIFFFIIWLSSLAVINPRRH